jgi:hypothetical protein
MKRWLALVGVALALAGTLQAGLLVHRAYGINLPWELPRHLDICERRYDGGFDRYPVPESRTLHLTPTVFLLPLPLPDLHPDDPSQPYGGCPALVILKLGDREIVYAPMQGGP